MKDSYTFDRDAEGLEERYQLHVGAYDRIMQRTGLRYYRVEADVGMMGGTGAHEYMAPCAAGENEVVLAGDYAANIEVASADPAPVTLPEAPATPEPVPTPGLTTVRDVAAELGPPRGCADEGLSGHRRGRRGERLGAGARARRPSGQRDQARARRSARRSRPARSRRRSRRSSARPATSVRSGAASERRDPARRALSPPARRAAT